ncbi:hypothetical protein JCM33374_g4070 [Metschnikowia sp. JCM 33374]|nr:hypothetical protein JCM33374_g4070 [Metschnikowia sp. JCM 33374]
MNDIRDLKARAPELKTVQIADFFNINPESIRRILKSKWEPGVAEQARQEKRAEVRKAESLQRKLAERELAKKGAILDTGVLKTGASEIGASEIGALKIGASENPEL